MFVDSVKITLSAGKGGNGVIAWRREKYIPKGGPTGGDGGRGGSIFLLADDQTLSLQDYRHKKIIVAKNGEAGGSNFKIGKSGADLVLKVPCGTLVKDKNTGEVLFDLTKHGEKILLCAGGKGGKGNHHFKSSTHQAPYVCTPGTPGETKEIELELKLIADVGLVGMPNAGKSTLISRTCHTRAKIGAYPFTTLFPNLGYLHCSNGSKVLLADIPGIIENAHANKGLGLAFLRHIERTSLIVFVIDISGFEGRDPLQDFSILQEEIRAYNPEILQKPFLVVLNKIDIEGAQENIDRFMKDIAVSSEQVICVSAEQRKGLPAFIQAISDSLQPTTMLLV